MKDAFYFVLAAFVLLALLRPERAGEIAGKATASFCLASQFCGEAGRKALEEAE